MPTMCPTWTLAVLILYTACTLALDQQPPRKSSPPTIFSGMQNEAVIYFMENGKGKEDLICRAIGSPPLEFIWTKNGEVLNVNEPQYISSKTNRSRLVRFDQGTGTLMISELKRGDEGVYQCIAKNVYGSSLSKKVTLVKATIGIYQEKDKNVVRYPVVPAYPLFLPCNPPDTDPHGKSKWVKYIKDETDTRSLDTDDRISIDDDGNLYFANIQQADDNFGEKYACLTNIMELSLYVEGAFSYVDVQEGDALVQFPPELLYHSKPDRIVGLKGKSASFKCIFGGNPTPRIEWVRTSGGKLNNQRMYKEHTELLVRGIQYNDAGTYECRGKNTVVSQPQKHRFTLTVEAAPEWTAEPQPVDAGVEESAAFECAATGKPTPVVRWFINGQPLEDMKPDPRRTLSSGQLMFHNLSLDDAQVVQCNTSNRHGYLWADVALSILAYKPEIKIPLQKVKVAEGHDVILPCDTDGKPKPKIYWKRENQKILGPRYRLRDAGNLTIVEAVTSDAGTYTCFTENRYGKANATGELLVRRRTTIVSPPFPRTQRAKHQGRIQLTCAATTDALEIDRLTISWLKNGEPVDLKDPRISLTSGHGLVIETTDTSDTGNYTCVASNGLDSDRAVAEVEIVGPPDAPTNVKYAKCQSRVAVVTWKPGKPNFSPISRYIVEFNHSYAPDIWTIGAIINDSKVKEATIQVSPFANYTFRVSAVNSVGQSQPSQHSRAVCITNPDKPDKHPSNVYTDRSKPGVLIIRWDRMPEIDHNADEFKYIVGIKIDGKTNKTIISDWRENVKEINIGENYKKFEYYVEAANSMGTYAKGAPFLSGYTGEAKPLSAPTNFELVNGTVTATSAWFQWDPVDTSPEIFRGQFHGYKIRFWKTGNKDGTLKTVMISRNSRGYRGRRAVAKERAEVTTLYPYSDLELDVVARNTYYDSNTSNSIDITTLEGVPGPVSYVKVLLRGWNHFLVEWGPPDSPNGELTGYGIGYQAVDGLDVGSMEMAEVFNDSERSRCYLGGLNEHTAYRVSVWASTKTGRGTEFTIDVNTANKGPLLTPKMKIELIGENFINVTWTVDSSMDKAAGSEHYVKYRKSGESAWMETEKEKVHSWMNVSTLQLATKYEVAVVASDGTVSEVSKIQEIVTKGGPAPTTNEETSIAQATWFIGMMVAIAVLILFLIVVCFIKRSRGEKYNVQDREKLRGADLEAPEKEHFNEYPKCGETDPLNAGSPDSFDNEPVKVLGGSESDSMADYGDVDPSRFNEDGSFIGQYTNQKPALEGNQQSAMSTFV